CNQPNGGVSIVVTVGTGPYTYNWSNGATTSSVTNVPTGTYTVTVTGANGCSGTATATVNNTTPPVLNPPTIVQATCNKANGSASVSLTSGGPVTYLWSTGATTTTVTGLLPGSYDVSATDGTGCVATASVVITSSPPPTINVTTTNSTCGNANGTATM